jgi:hypothetical protein
MTTHDEQTDTTASVPADQPSSAPMDADSAPAQPAPVTATDEPSAAPAEPSEASDAAAAPTAEAEKSSDRLLFADDDLSGLRTRWDDVQAGFVDDPKGCVQKADSLVADVVEQLTSGFSDARSRLEAQWARGEEPSTEDLRQALKRYREFFERLLAV